MSSALLLKAKLSHYPRTTDDSEDMYDDSPPADDVGMYEEVRKYVQMSSEKASPPEKMMANASMPFACKSAARRSSATESAL